MEDEVEVFVRVVDHEWGTTEHARAVVEAFLDWETPPHNIRLEQLPDGYVSVMATGGIRA